MPTEPPVSAIARAWPGLTCRPLQRRRPHRPRSQHSRVRQQQRLGRDLDRLLRHVLGRMRDIADKAEPITGADHFGAEFGETLMGDRAGLEITDVVWRVVHELHMPDAPLMRLLQPFEFPLEEIETLDIGDDRRLSRLVRRFEIGGIQRAAHTVTGDQLVHPGEAVEMVPVKLARCRRSHHSEGPFRAATEHRPVRHVGQAGDRQRSRPHRVCEIAARRRLRGDAGAAAMAMDIDTRWRCAARRAPPLWFRRSAPLASNRAVRPRRRASLRPRPAACLHTQGWGAATWP